MWCVQNQGCSGAQRYNRREHCPKALDLFCIWFWIHFLVIMCSETFMAAKHLETYTFSHPQFKKVGIKENPHGPVCWLALTVNLTQSRIIGEESLHEGLPRSGWLVGTTVRDCFEDLNWYRKTQSTVGGTIWGFCALDSVKVEKVTSVLSTHAFFCVFDCCGGASYSKFLPWFPWYKGL